MTLVSVVGSAGLVGCGFESLIEATGADELPILNDSIHVQASRLRSFVILDGVCEDVVCPGPSREVGVKLA